MREDLPTFERPEKAIWGLLSSGELLQPGGACHEFGGKDLHDMPVM